MDTSHELSDGVGNCVGGGAATTMVSGSVSEDVGLAVLVIGGRSVVELIGFAPTFSILDL